MKMNPIAALVAAVFLSACCKLPRLCLDCDDDDDDDDNAYYWASQDAGDWRADAAPRGRGGGGGTTDGGPPTGGTCTSIPACGGGLVCNRATGACSSPSASCGEVSFVPPKSSAEVLLVLDRSKSMSRSTATGTKWSDLTRALGDVIVRTPEVHWGLSLFPASSSQSCVVGSIAAPPRADSASLVLNHIRAELPEGSGTPTREAVARAAESLLSIPSSARRYLLLATDGEPNCALGLPPSQPDADGAVRSVREAALSGISTFVVGVAATSDAESTLARMAEAGGQGRRGAFAYFATTNATDLQATLASVARQVALCTFDLDPPPPAAATPELSIGGRSFPRDMSRMGDGWDITGGGRAITLYGAACEAVQSQGRVTVRYTCPADAGANARPDAGAPADARSGVDAGSGGNAGAGGVAGSGGNAGSDAGSGVPAADCYSTPNAPHPLP